MLKHTQNIDTHIGTNPKAHTKVVPMRTVSRYTMLSQQPPRPTNRHEGAHQRHTVRVVLCLTGHKQYKHVCLTVLYTAITYIGSCRPVTQSQAIFCKTLRHKEQSRDQTLKCRKIEYKPNQVAFRATHKTPTGPRLTTCVSSHITHA